MQVSRRRFVATATVLGSAAALELAGCKPPRLRLPVGPPPPPPSTLKEAGTNRGMLVGCAVNVARLRDTPEYAALVRTQAQILVAENTFKFGPLRPAPDRFFFEDTDFLLQFAKTYAKSVRGHNFVWHESLPAWFDSYVTPQNAEQVMVEHITKVAGRYSGRIHSWDVVNEAIDLNDHLPGGLRNSPWFRMAGPNYIDIAFRAAHKADPKASLIYNDYGFEADDPASVEKRAAVLALVKGMVKRGVPIDGLGIQSHLMAGPGQTYGPGIRELIKELHGMGLKTLITELDVNDRELPPDIAVRDQAVAALYESYLGQVLGEGFVTELLTWGITDRFTWLNGPHFKDSRQDGLPERPLPFDADYKPKPAFTAQMKALVDAPAMIPVLRRRTKG